MPRHGGFGGPPHGPGGPHFHGGFGGPHHGPGGFHHGPPRGFGGPPPRGPMWGGPQPPPPPYRRGGCGGCLFPFLFGIAAIIAVVAFIF